jgi:hypothetical protein
VCKAWHCRAEVAFDLESDGEDMLESFIEEAVRAGFKIASFEFIDNSKNPLDWREELDDDNNPTWIAKSRINRDGDTSGADFAQYNLKLLLKDGRPQWYVDHDDELITLEIDGERWFDDLDEAKRVTNKHHDKAIEAAKASKATVDTSDEPEH